MLVSGVPSFGRNYATERAFSSASQKNRYINTIEQQKTQNKKNACKLAVAVAAIVGAIAFRKPLGKALQPIKNKLSKAMPNVSEAFKSVKARAGRIFKPMKDNATKWVNDTAVPNAKKGATNFWKGVKKAADSDLKEAVHRAPDIIYQGAGAPRPLLPPPV